MSYVLVAVGGTNSRSQRDPGRAWCRCQDPSNRRCLAAPAPSRENPAHKASTSRIVSWQGDRGVQGSACGTVNLVLESGPKSRKTVRKGRASLRSGPAYPPNWLSSKNRPLRFSGRFDGALGQRFGSLDRRGFIGPAQVSSPLSLPPGSLWPVPGERRGGLDYERDTPVGRGAGGVHYDDSARGKGHL
jgi:hypothetical protein